MRQRATDIAEILYQKYCSKEIAKGFGGEESHQEDGWLSPELANLCRRRANRDQSAMQDCLHTVKLGFQAVMPAADPDGESIAITPVTHSNHVQNTEETESGELKIAEVSHSCGSVLGGDSIWMRCASRVRKEEVRIKFFEPSTGWESEVASAKFYDQVLVIFNSPAYRDTSIRERVCVNVQLERVVKTPNTSMPNENGSVTNGTARQEVIKSPPIDFVYIPNENDLTEADLRKPSPAPAFQLTELKSVLADLPDDHGVKMERLLADLWSTHLNALWNFSEEGNPHSLVAASRHLISCQDQDGNTSLHIAVKHRQPFALKTLLSGLENVNDRTTIINSVNRKKQTPLDLAIKFSDAECVHYLITHGADRTMQDSDGWNAGHYLSETFSEDIYKDVLFPPKKPDEDPENADASAPSSTTLAAASGATPTTNKQLNLGLLNDAGESPVHLAVRKLKLALLESLIEAKAPLDVPERSSGKRPIHIAVEMGDTEAVELLIQNKVDINAEALDGATPLHWAILYRHEPIIVKLIRAGADPDLRTAQCERDNAIMDIISGDRTEQRSPRDLAAGNERLLKLLNGKVLPGLTQPASISRPGPPDEMASSVHRSLPTPGPSLQQQQQQQQREPTIDRPLLPSESTNGTTAISNNSITTDQLTNNNHNNADANSSPQQLVRQSTVSALAAAAAERRRIIPIPFITRRSPSITVAGENDEREENGEEVDSGYLDMAIGGAHVDVDQTERPIPSSSSPSSLVSHRLWRDDNDIRELPLPTQRIKDDLGSLDFVTRLRLSKLLDKQSRWERLATALDLGDTCELIQACIDAEEGSPTVLLLDQYEQVRGSCISSLMLALNSIDERDAVDLIANRVDHFADQSSGLWTSTTTTAAGAAAAAAAETDLNEGDDNDETNQEARGSSSLNSASNSGPD